MRTNNLLIESEQQVIGSLLIDNDCIDELSGLKADAFSVVDYQIMFRAIQSLISRGEKVDIIILAEQLERDGDLERVGNLKHIGEIIQGVGSTRIVKSHAQKVINRWKLRKLKSLLGELSFDVESAVNVEEILEKAESGMFSLLEGDEESHVSHINEAVIEAIEWEDSDRKGVQTGLRDLDRLTGGFCKSNMIIIAARPSMGKSALACQIAENVSRNEPVLIFSLEMSKREIGSRLLKFHEERVGKSQAIAHAKELMLHIDDKPAVTLQHIRSQCRKMKRKHGLGMIVIDYLQLMQGDGDNRNQEIGSISRGLKAIAKEFEVPVVALSQLSRRVDERADKRPIMSDLRDSGEIEQDADVILFIYRDEVYDQSSPHRGTAEIICRKNRNGSIGEVTTKFNGAVTRFSDYNGAPILRSVKTQHRGFD